MKTTKFIDSDKCFKCGGVLACANIWKFCDSDKSLDQEEPTNLFLNVCFALDCPLYRLPQIPMTIEKEIESE